MEQKNVKGAVGSVLVLALLGKLLGLLRDRLLGVTFGAGLYTDAFMTASRIPRVFFDVIFASAISICFIPVISALHEREGRKRALQFGGELTGLAAIVTLAISVLGMIFAAPLTRLFAAGYDAETMAIAVRLTRIMFPTVFLTGVAYSFVGILQSLECFAVPASISLVSNGLIIIYYYTLCDRFGIWGLAAAFLIGWTAQILVMVPSLKRRGFRLTTRLNAKSEDMRAVLKLMVPVLVSAWVQPVTLTIGTRFASGFGEGTVTALELATNLNLIIVGVFVLSVTNVMFPRISRLEAAGRELWSPTRASLGVTLYVTLPIMCGVMLLARPLIAFVYGGGEFDAAAVALTSQAMRWGAPSMIGFAVGSILGRVYFARRDGVRPLIAGILGIISCVAMCLALTGTMGIRGIALSGAVAVAVNALALLIPLLKDGLMTPPFAVNLLKTALGTAVMTAAVYFLMKAMPLGNLLLCIASAAAGAIIYFVVTLLIGVRAAWMVWNTMMQIAAKLGLRRKNEESNIDENS